MSRKYKIGVITPSSNTTLEPILYEILKHTRFTAHFSRFKVRNLSLEREDLEQFSIENMLVPASLLADAHVDVIAWFGTSGGWLGFDNDINLCRRIEDRLGIPAVTATLATVDAMAMLKIRNYSLVVPYEEDLTKKIIDNFGKAGYSVSNVKHLNLRDNVVVGSVPTTRIAKIVTDTSANSDCILVYCTNFSVATMVEELEKKTRIPILDSINVTLWGCMKKLGIRSGIKGYGMLLAGRRPRFWS
ncbi:MAG: hypothetical protein QXV32_06365 [Conexivisphaerales archaeon]